MKVDKQLKFKSHERMQVEFISNNVDVMTHDGLPSVARPSITQQSSIFLSCALSSVPLLFLDLRHHIISIVCFYTWTNTFVIVPTFLCLSNLLHSDIPTGTALFSPFLYLPQPQQNFHLSSTFSRDASWELSVYLYFYFSALLCTAIICIVLWSQLEYLSGRLLQPHGGIDRNGPFATEHRQDSVSSCPMEIHPSCQQVVVKWCSLCFINCVLFIGRAL